MSATIQNILIILGLLVLAAFAYYLLVVQNNSLLETAQTEANDAEIQAFLNQLNQLKSVSFQTDIFSNQTFQSLVDQSAPVNPQPIRRVNPFVPQQ